MIRVRKYSRLGFGSINRELEDNSKTNFLHPSRLTEEQIERYGRCHTESTKKAKALNGRVYRSLGEQHSVAVKNSKVWDYVLGIEGMPLTTYVSLVPMRFEVV